MPHCAIVPMAWGQPRRWLNSGDDNSDDNEDNEEEEKITMTWMMDDGPLTPQALIVEVPFCLLNFLCNQVPNFRGPFPDADTLFFSCNDIFPTFFVAFFCLVQVQYDASVGVLPEWKVGLGHGVHVPCPGRLGLEGLAPLALQLCGDVPPQSRVPESHAH